MHDARVAGSNLDGPHVACSLDGRREDDVPEDVFALGPQEERLGRLQHEIGRAELPAVAKSRHARSPPRFAFWSARTRPGLQRRDLTVGKALFAGKSHVSGLGQPGRHVASSGDAGDLPGTPAGVAVADERKGTCASRVVTGHAVLVEDWRHIARKRRLLARNRGPRRRLPSRCGSSSQGPHHRGGRHHQRHRRRRSDTLRHRRSAMMHPTAAVTRGSFNTSCRSASMTSSRSCRVGRCRRRPISS